MSGKHGMDAEQGVFILLMVAQVQTLACKWWQPLKAEALHRPVLPDPAETPYGYRLMNKAQCVQRETHTCNAGGMCKPVLAQHARQQCHEAELEHTLASSSALQHVSAPAPPPQ